MTIPDPRELRRIFDEDAELYDAARPRYPDELVEDLVTLGRLAPEDRVLEIGCGTGQLTIPLARRGLEIVCVELGERMATVARRNLARFPDVAVESAAFETWDPAGRSFEMVVAATSWHWLDPEVRYEKVAQVLKVGGRLAIISTQHVLPEGGDEFFREIQEVYEALGVGVGSGGPPHPEEVPDLLQEIEASGLFEGIEVRSYLSPGVYTADQYIDLLNSYSGHRAMEPETRRRLYDEIRLRITARPDGWVTKHNLNQLHVARGKPTTH